jgi:hypothetical protein
LDEFFSKSAPENMIYSQKNVSLRPSGLTLHNLAFYHFSLNAKQKPPWAPSTTLLQQIKYFTPL